MTMYNLYILKSLKYFLMGYVNMSTTVTLVFFKTLYTHVNYYYTSLFQDTLEFYDKLQLV